MSQALVLSTRNRSLASVGKEFETSTDRTVQEAIRNITISKQRFVALDAWIRQILNLPRSRTRSFIARGLNRLIPQRFIQQMPDFVAKMVAEEFNALEAAESRGRTIINEMQINILTLVEVTKAKGEELETLKANIERFKAENWNAQQLHKYIFDSIGIKVDQEIAELLNDRFNILSQEEKENKRQALLNTLEKNVLMDEASVDLNVRTCLGCLEVLTCLGVEFFNFVRHYKQAAAMRDAAITLIEGSTVMYGSKSAIAATYTTSLKAIDDALEATRVCRKHSIVSADMQKLLKTGRKDIDEKLKLMASEETQRLAEIGPATIGDSNTIDVEVIEASASYSQV